MLVQVCARLAHCAPPLVPIEFPDFRPPAMRTPGVSRRWRSHVGAEAWTAGSRNLDHGPAELLQSNPAKNSLAVTPRVSMIAFNVFTVMFTRPRSNRLM